MSDIKLTLVKNDAHEHEITDQDSRDLNVEKLRRVVNEGFYSLQGSLANQAIYELKRLAENRKVLDLIGSRLFTQEVIDQLDPIDQLKLYQMKNSESHESLGFLLEYQNTISKGLEATQQIEKEKNSRISKDELSKADGNKLDKIKEMILNKIKEKSKA